MKRLSNYIKESWAFYVNLARIEALVNAGIGINSEDYHLPE